MPLAAGKQRTALPDIGIKSVFQRFDKVIKISHFQSTGNFFFGSIFFAKQDIAAQTAGKQEIILKNHRNFIAQRFQGVITNVLPVNGDLSGSYVIKSGQKIDESALTATGISNQGNRGSGFDFQVNIF